ncbi:MAG: hypothetical protein ACEQSQ_06055 [Candidatus Paceibacteria bacterium]
MRDKKYDDGDSSSYLNHHNKKTKSRSTSRKKEKIKVIKIKEELDLYRNNLKEFEE